MRSKQLGFARDQDLRWEDLSAKRKKRLLELLSQLMEQAWRRREGRKDER